jgi:phenylalanyl-tRNA synthetase beta chain
LRIYGFNNIEIPAKLNASITIKPSPDKEALRNTVSDLLVSNGFCEMMANSLSSSQMHENLGLLSNEVYMANPLSSELNILRTDLIVGSLDAVAYNLNRQVERIKLFEFGKSYQVSETGFNETNHLTITLAGKKEGDSWVGKEEEQNFYSIKKSVIQCLAKLGINDYVETKSSASYLSNGISLERGNKELVIFGEVSKKALTHFKIKQPVFYAKFNWDLLVKRKAKIKTLYTEIAKFPSVKRDLSLLIDSEIEFQSLEKIALKHGGKILKKVSIFDVYNGDKLPKGKKSYALNFELQDVEQTLTDKKIEFTMNKLMEAYKKEVNADIRM